MNKRIRSDLARYLHQQLVGPADGTHETMTAPPDRRYLLGTLFPGDTDFIENATESGEEFATVSDGTDAAGLGPAHEEDAASDDPLQESDGWLPSTMGMSFFTNATELSVACSAARYPVTGRTDRGRVWQRAPLPEEQVRINAEAPAATIFDGHAQLTSRWRAYGVGYLVTVAIANTQPTAKGDAKWDNLLFQVGFSVEPLDGLIREYPSFQLASTDPEEQELRLQYRHVRTFAVGHGCAVEAPEEALAATARWLRTEVLPQATVPDVRHGGPVDDPRLRLRHLADPAITAVQLHEELSAFVDGYRAWLDEQRTQPVPPWADHARLRILTRIENATDRMQAGVAALTEASDPAVLDAFRVANRAMALQMRHIETDLGGDKRTAGAPIAQAAEPNEAYAWRPFQLGFFLMVICGLIDPNRDDRSTADLIWFPTGGGKTEAYLLVAAFEIALRRMRAPDADGVTVLSRYTLSLLTTQQFQRAATTICALEYIRAGHDGGSRGEPTALGARPITIGLWVGEGTTPNSYEKADQAMDRVRDDAQPKNPFLLDRCPWCGTEIVPERRKSHAHYGVRTTSTSFRFFCPREDCVFHGELPVAVVDEHLYDRPPTFLLGTVDKFARLAWEPRAGRLFGDASGTGPSLIIQDELHLLSGPLGTTVGLYEAAILRLCARNGPPPKIIAATATIRGSESQVRAMYGRDVQLFPPAGIDARYSYFSEPDDERPGRLYAGIMAQGHTAGRALAITAATLLQAPIELADDTDGRDAYWTLVAYHHSMRELGRTRTAAKDDIPAELYARGRDGRRRELREIEVAELTSNLDRAQQPEVLRRLELPYTDRSSVALVPCTNMLSVGVDVKRLALMLMLGQPKTTAEYIQATSRVGRHAVPGFVLTLFSPAKPRDRSHYETFGVYHGSLYRQVEPSSVTPWSLPSRHRALHAALVILVRHAIGLNGDGQAGEVLDHPEEFEEAGQWLRDHVAEADPDTFADASKGLAEFMDRWRRAAAEARSDGKPLTYRPNGKAGHHLLRTFGDKHTTGKETPHSMRNVDRECQIRVRGVRP